MDDPAWNSDPLAALAEAERRIEEGGAGWWYGHRPYVTALERLPRNLRQLTSKRVDLSATRVADLSGLMAKPDLESLALNDRVSDISAVGALDRLEELVAFKAPVQDISALRGCRALRTLQLNVAGVADLSPLADLPGLERLELWSYRGQALWPSGTIHHLTIIHGTQRSANLTPLATWPKLKVLSCDGPVWAGTLPLLPQLEFLSIPGCSAEDFGALSGCVHLRNLHAYNGTMADIRPLAGCAELEFVSLSNTPVSEIGPLLDTSNLRRLVISGTRVPDISRLSWLPRLESLHADRTPVRDLTGWNPRSAIRYLVLSDTEVASLHPLRGAALQSLDIARTPASDLRFLAALPSLTGLDVSGTNVGDLTPILEHPKLLEDVSNLDYRDRLGNSLDFRDTPAARNDPALMTISLLDGSAETGLRQNALRQRFGFPRG